MIFYFSCTGNTRWAAEMLATELREELVDMAHDSRDSYHLEEDERIGFCFPVHGWRPSVLVRRFIDKLVIENADGHFCWALCTAGDDIGQSMEYLNDDLKRNGLQGAKPVLADYARELRGASLYGCGQARKGDGQKENCQTDARIIHTSHPRKKDWHH